MADKRIQPESQGLLWNGTAWESAGSIEQYKTAAASPDVGIAAVGLADRRFSALSLGTVVGNTQQWDVMAASMALIHVGSTQTGTFIIEVSADGTNWASAEVRDTALDTWVSGQNLTPTANKVYRVMVNGWRQMRVRTVTTLGGTVAMTTTLAQINSLINAIDSGPAPHNIGYDWVNKNGQQGGAATGVALWTPASGKKIVVTSFDITVVGSVGTDVVIWFGASGDTTWTVGTDATVFYGNFIPSASISPGVTKKGVWQSPTADHVLRLTAGGANSYNWNIWGYEI